MTLQSSASAGDPICLSEIKTEFDLISSDCLKGFYGVGTVPGSGEICLTDFLGQAQEVTFSPSTSVTWNTTGTPVKGNYIIFGDLTGHIYNFEYTHSSSTTHTLKVMHNHGGTGTTRSNHPYSQTPSFSGDNDGYFTSTSRWNAVADYSYITKVVYTFSSVYYGDDFTLTAEKPSGGWGGSAWSHTASGSGGFDNAGMHTHTFSTPPVDNQHLQYTSSGACGTTSDRLNFTATFTYIPH